MAAMERCNTADQSNPYGYTECSDWDEPLTDEQLLAIEEIEAAHRSSLPTSSSPNNNAQETDDYQPRRRLPLSVVSSSWSKRFALSPCQAVSGSRFPEMRFEGRILYSRTALEVEKAASHLLRVLEAKKKFDKAVLGFDIEWRPTFRRGVLPGRAAVMQICLDSRQCHVMHIFHSGIPRSLQALLEDSNIRKVGVGIKNDAAKIYRDYDLSIKDVEDLSDVAGKKFGEGLKKWSLASLAQNVAHKELPKPNDIRLGNWEAKFLSGKQLKYAATDAFASWHIYQVLKSFPDPELCGETEAASS